MSKPNHPASFSGESMTSPRSVRPQKPRTRTFRYSEDSRPSNRVPKDDRTLNPSGPQVEVVRPKWNGKGPLTFRPLPMFCAEDPNGAFEPTRLSTNPYDFSDFYRGYPAAKYVGIESKFTFVTYDPRWPRETSYNPRQENPFHVLYNALADASKSGKAMCAGRNLMTTEWIPLISANSNDKAISAPTKLYFMQGAIFEDDGEVFTGRRVPKGFGEEDLPQIIELAKTAGDDIASRLNMLNPEYTGDTLPEYQSEMYAFGDLVNLKTGSFITVYNPDKHAVVGVDAAAHSNREFKSWCASISPEFCYIAQRQTITVGPDISKYEDIVRDRLVWWDDVLYIPTTEEICVWMAQAFCQFPDMLRFAWTDNPEFFSDDVNGILANRAAIPAADTGTHASPRGPVMPPEDPQPAPAPQVERDTSGPRRSSALPVAPVEELEEYLDAALTGAVDSPATADPSPPEPSDVGEVPARRTRRIVKRIVRRKKSDE